MCGISGVFSREGEISDDQRAAVTAGAQRQHRRGPDAFGVLARPALHFAHNRLAIIDLTTGDQPMVDDESECSIVFNGEIYNYVELRRTLMARGHRFRTESDTEVLLKAYAEFGPDMLQQLNGMFAFALHDGRRRTLFLARDRFGEKPLYYFSRGGTVSFASTLQTLTRMVDCPRESDPAALAEYFAFGYVSGPRTMLREVRQVRPGHVLRVDETGIVESPYWHLPDAGNQPAPADDELGALLDDAIRLRLRADVPVASLLSGGIDSSLITVIAQRASATPLRTFSFGWQHADSELPWARTVATLAGTVHHESMLDRETFVRDVDDVIDAMDMPFADSAAFVVHQLSRQIANAGVKVVLTGEGGDELFGGYPWYRGAHTPRHRLKRLLRGSRATARAYVTDVITSDLELLRRSLGAEPLEQAILERTDCAERLGDSVNGRIAFDYAYFLPWLLLPKVDRMSMAHSVEMRAPLLDHRLVEMWIRVRSSEKVADETSKRGLKAFLRRSRLIPLEILDRPKTGMNLPIAWWIRSNESLFREPLSGDSDVVRLFGRAAVDGWFQTLHRETGNGWSRSAQSIWSAFIMEAWSRRTAS